MSVQEEFAPQFENMQIQHLINQYPVIQDVTGDIRFVIDDEGRLAKASLTLEDGDFDRLWASGIKLPLIEFSMP